MIAAMDLDRFKDPSNLTIACSEITGKRETQNKGSGYLTLLRIFARPLSFSDLIVLK